MCGSMVDIQCPTAVIRRGKKDKRRRKKKQDENIMVCHILHRATIIISKQQNDTNYTLKSQTSNLRNVHHIIMTVISPNDCPTPFNTRAW